MARKELEETGEEDDGIEKQEVQSVPASPIILIYKGVNPDVNVLSKAHLTDIHAKERGIYALPDIGGESAATRGWPPPGASAQA